ncbi:MAG: hypothetical protein ACK47B_06260 [Armatimonadota bacterium]
MRKSIIALTLGTILAGTLAVPALADRNDRDRRRAGGAVINRTAPRYRNASDRNWRNEMDRRADRIADRARSLYRNRRLSARHRDEVLEKLQRIRNDVRHRDRIDAQRFRANMEHLDRTERTMEQWSRSDTRIIRRR